MSKRPCILLVANESLLGDILENLLTGKVQQPVYRTTPWEYKSLLQMLYPQRPVVMVVEAEAFNGKSCELTNLANRYGRLPILSISSERDEVYIYPHNRITVTGTAHLLTLIHTTACQLPGAQSWYIGQPITLL
jgi:hypothetical protein